MGGFSFHILSLGTFLPLRPLLTISLPRFFSPWIYNGSVSVSAMGRTYSHLAVSRLNIWLRLLCKLWCMCFCIFPISGGGEREMMMMMTLIVVVVVVERYGVSMKLALSQFRAQKLLHFEMEEHWVGLQLQPLHIWSDPTLGRKVIILDPKKSDIFKCIFGVFWGYFSDSWRKIANNFPK